MDFVNDGVVIQTKAYGEVRVREFNFQQLNRLLKALARVFVQVSSFSAGDEDAGQALLANIDKIDFQDGLDEIVAAAIEQPKPLDLTLTEGLTIVEAIVDLNDWGRIKGLFFKMMAKANQKTD